ncbi:cilia- and flagella-associated protein 251 isoform X2 [Brachyhypopomus gauderio]|uniref:cilia- and flagella-associated protein 251 isoform X2 n=1 Tax=Brachyhypopomus gauderio TaxID=698409 RepID=UPI004041A7BA
MWAVEQTSHVSDEDEEDSQREEQRSSADEQVDGELQTENGETSDNEHEISSPETKDEYANSEVYTAASLSLKTKEKSVKTQPLTLDWALGINQTLPVFNLLDQDSLVILYGCAHVAVIRDHTSNTQRLLQGHSGPISSLCVSEDRRWLVSADSGSENLVIVWDSFTGIPVLTLFDCHPEGGIVALALSKDSKYLATVGGGPVQRVYIWDWTNEGEGPTCQTDISPQYGCQNHILFNPADSSQLLSNSKSHVLFYTWDKGILQYTAPELSDKMFSKVVGSLSRSVFHFTGLQAFSVTLAGNLVLWESLEATTTHQHHTMKATKLIPLQKDGITALTMCDSLIVTGDVRGHIKFYDENFKLISWCNKFNLDTITSISFSKEIPVSSSPEQQEDCTPQAKQFVIRNFVVSTVSAAVVYVSGRGSLAQTVLREHQGPVHTVSCHPKQPLLATGGHDGMLRVWDYEQKVVISSRVFHDQQIQCIAYDPQGFYLAVGFCSGAVQVLDSCSLQQEEQEGVQYSQDCITHLIFSHDSSLLATADSSKAVMVFHLCEEAAGHSWKYLSKQRSHYEPVQDLLFGLDLDTRQPRLLSLGMDRRLVEYDLQNSRKDELPILSSQRVEQDGVPTCMAWYPPLTPEHFLLTASSHYKMRLFNVTTKMCRKTVLGPTYGSPVKRIQMLPPSTDGHLNSRYMAYITQDKVGLQILPLDGNPFKSSAVLCHSTAVSSLTCSYDGRYVFTAGGVDRAVFSWGISLPALEAAAALGGKDLLPFYTLLEGGRDGELFRDMEDFFYYCQLRNHGIDSMETIGVSNHIPLSEVTYGMRALGFYPTEQQLEDMQNEVKFSRYAETGNYVTHVDLQEFIKLFVNHRPVCGTSWKELCKAFQVLGAAEDGWAVITREDLLELLQTRGERMTEEELGECFTTLLGSNEEGAPPQSETDQFLLESELPPNFTVATFARRMLGFPISSEEVPHDQHSSSSSSPLL